MRSLLSISLIVADLGLAVAQDGPPQLDGKYEVIEVVSEGVASAEAKKEISAVVIKDGTLTIKLTKKDEVMKFKLDPSKKPAEIDFTNPREKGPPLPGIYQLKETNRGLELTIALMKEPTTPATKLARPKDFKGDGDYQTVLKLLRPK